LGEAEDVTSCRSKRELLGREAKEGDGHQGGREGEREELAMEDDPLAPDLASLAPTSRGSISKAPRSSS